jgi:hypothetical protein
MESHMIYIKKSILHAVVLPAIAACIGLIGALSSLNARAAEDLTLPLGSPQKTENKAR